MRRRQGTFVRVRITKELGKATDEFYLIRGGSEFLEHFVLKKRLEDACKALEVLSLSLLSFSSTTDKYLTRSKTKD
eukprot:761205-Hanusia_phi.AAC.3